ncbi:hypothetical protein A2U01_0109273, partial [Trifolium medium]|nr:hypothetical protein [Trifolium medium]
GVTASTSNIRINGDQDHTVTSPPREHNTVLSPVQNNDAQMPENITGDPRDGEEASPFTEDEDEVQVLTER